jgi:hypothetical protein
MLLAFFFVYLIKKTIIKNESRFKLRKRIKEAHRG